MAPLAVTKQYIKRAVGSSENLGGENNVVGELLQIMIAFMGG